MRFIYEIDDADGFAIKLWDTDFPNENNEPIMYQPHYPIGEVWESKEEAISWAEAKIAEISDPDAPYAPVGRGIPATPKPTEEQIREAKLASLGLTVEELRALLGL
jgi:hypothetical protein